MRMRRQKSADGKTPLDLLFHKEKDKEKEIAELLIAAGADVNAKNKRGSTPLDWAIKRNQLKTADLLRKHSGKTGEKFNADEK